MKNNWVSIDRSSVNLLNFNEDIVSEIEEEIENGVEENEFEITAFKVEQKITDITNSNAIDIGGFVNGNSNIKNLQVRYLATLFSNKFKTIKDSEGNIITRKRYGYGFGFTLNVSDINTKINANFGVLAASAALDLSKVGYTVDVYGTVTPQLAEHLPDTQGSFDTKAFEQLQKFIEQAKLELNTANINKLYPIEMLNSTIKLEDSDIESMYFGVLKVKQGAKLKDTIVHARNLKTFRINENVVQFIYSYFEIKDAYTSPNQDQKQNARRWIAGTYNKVDKSSINETSWVDVDPATEDDQYVVLANSSFGSHYKPHPKPANWATEVKLLKDDKSEVSLDFSSSLRIASTVDLSSKFNTITINRSIGLSIDVSDQPFEGSKVLETRYGVGIRLKIRISNIAIGTKIKYNIIGSASELGHANVEYEVSGIGISDADFLKELPGPINISQNSITDINDAFDSLKKKLADMDVNDLNPQPYRIKVKEPEKIDPTLKAQAMVFGVGKIANRVRLGDAIEDAIQVGIDEKDIKALYKDYGITDLDKRISYSDRREARDWLLMSDD